ncbi:MAG: hypothetical protein R3F31_28555 [Verrucomicrobiales bacterium]
MVGKILDAITASPDMKGKTWVLLSADHGGLTLTKGHGEAKESDNYTIGYFAWGPGVPVGGDLYALNAASRKDPGTVNPPYDSPGQPIRNGDTGNLVLSLLGLPAIPGSTINPKQDLVIRSPK